MRRENVSGFLRSPRRAQVKTTPERFVLGFIKFLGTPLAVAALLAAMVAVTRAREGNWERAALAASIAIACAGAGIGAIWWVRFHARGVDPSERLRAANPDAPWMWREDWAAGEVRTSREARRKSADDHRDRMVRRNVSDLLHRAPSRAPKRRLLLAAIC